MKPLLYAPDLKTAMKEAEHHRDLGWCALFDGDLPRAIEQARRATAYLNTAEVIIELQPIPA